MIVTKFRTEGIFWKKSEETMKNYQKTIILIVEAILKIGHVQVVGCGWNMVVCDDSKKKIIRIYEIIAYVSMSR